MSNKSLNQHFPTAQLNPKRVRLIVIDSFCGAGGFTEGVERAVDADGFRLAVVVVGINHDAMAIASHAANHPETTHFVEDIRDPSMPKRIGTVIKKARRTYPNAVVLFHASLECTNFSNAKGGKPRDADSRSLADFMPSYLTVIKPDVFTVENVREFMSWGPLDEKGKPKSRKKGEDYVRWYQGIEALGYQYDYRLHNTADYGANTSRTRYFAQFVRHGLPLAWPQPTHAKHPEKAQGLFGAPLQRWKPIRECLDLDDKGRSIFRDKPLSEKTYERIFEGLVRHVGNGDRSFISKYFTGEGMHSSLDQPAATIKTVDNQALVTTEPFMARLFATASNNHGTYPTDQPATTITTADGHAVITPQPFAMTYNSGSPENRVKSLDEPAQTLLTENTIALVSPTNFCMKYHGIGDNTFGTEEPCSTLTTTDRVGLVSVEQFMSHYYNGGGQDASMQDPAAAITTNPHHRLVSAQFVADPQWNGHTHDLNKPGSTIIARQDKAPLSLVFIDQYYGNSKPASLDDPSGALTTKPKQALIEAAFITQRNGFDAATRNAPLDDPAKTLTTTGGNQEMVSAQYLHSNIHMNSGRGLDVPGPTLMTGDHHYLMTTNFSNVGVNLESPSPTITADRHWAYLMTAQGGGVPVIVIYQTDTFWQRRIKAFMAEHGIVDVLMRMLKVVELKKIQGFPADYVLKGSDTLKKKFIGNSVPPAYPKAWMEAIGTALSPVAQV